MMWPSTAVNTAAVAATLTSFTYNKIHQKHVLICQDWSMHEYGFYCLGFFVFVYATPKR